MCTSQLPKPRPQKSSFYYNSCHVTVYVISRRRRRRECERSIVTVHWSCDRLCFVTKNLWFPSLFPLINWKCPQQYLLGWSELTLVPTDVNLRKMLTSKVKITRVNWTGPSYSSGTLLLRTPQLYRGEPAPQASGSSTMIALREMHASASGRIE